MNIDPAQLIEQSPDAMILADREGIVRVWNAAAGRIFGHPPQAAIGQSLDIIIPERFRDAHWTGYDRALLDGATKYAGQSLATRSVRANGDTFYVELSFAILLGDTGEALGALATARDITERFEQDREQRRRLADLQKQVEEASSTS